MAESSRGSSRRSGSAGGRKSSSSRGRSAARSRSSSARSTAARKGGRARGRQQTAQKRGRQAARGATAPAKAVSSRLDVSGKSVAELRDAIARGIVAPLNLVMLTRERIEEVLDDAVRRGRVTADDARDLARRLFERGRKQTNDVLSDLEQLLGRGRDELQEGRRRSSRATGRTRQAGEASSRARATVRAAGDVALAQADRVRRTVGVGPSFPILAYDDLTAGQVQSRLDGLTPAELRKIRDYERRNANRKSVLDAIEGKLS